MSNHRTRKQAAAKPPVSLLARSPLTWVALTATALTAAVIGLTIKPASQAAVTWPTTPPAFICGANILNGPATAPGGAITVASGDNSSVNFTQANATYWFAPGTHTLGTDQSGQIIPADNSTFIGAPGAVLDGQGKNKYAFTQKATGVTVKYLTIQNFGAGSSSAIPSGDNNNEGVVNHDAGHSWIIQYNTVRYVAGAGVFVGTGDNLSYNCLTQNGQYGFSAFEAADVSNVTLDHNEISYNNTYDWESKVSGCGCTGGGKFWRTHGAVVTNNYVHDNHSAGVWADTDNSSFDIESNYISNNFGEGIIYEISYNFLVKNNNFISNAIGAGKADSGFPHSAVYISESGSDSRVAGAYNAVSQITGNSFTNNWDGVILWENANRYCASSANTSASDCTLVNPGTVNLTTCANASLLATIPYINDCRWKTKNVQVTGNTFNMTPGTIGPACTPTVCGFNGIFSEWGSYPPYTAQYVEDNIMYNQGNVFANNTYAGTWYFMAHELGNRLAFAQWQASPSNQDSGSTYPTPAPSLSPTPTPSHTPTPTPSHTPTPTPSRTPTPTPTPPPGKVGDVNGDGQVNVFDLSILLSNWNTSYAPADLNHDGAVNVFDLSIILSRWGT